MFDKRKRNQIRKYFTTNPNAGFGWAFFLLGAAAVAYFLGTENYDDSLILSSVGLGIFGGVVMLGAIINRISIPGDRTIDKWFDQDMQKITKRAMNKLDLDKVQLVNKEPLRAIGPIIWSEDDENEIPFEDWLWKKGKDDYLRFSIYEVALIYTAEHLIALYVCVFNTLKNSIVYEGTREFHYQDIVAVTTLETSIKVNMRKKKEQTYVIKRFEVSVSSGDSIDVTIDLPKLDKKTKGSRHKNEVEKTVQRMRNLLRDKKQSAMQAIPTAPPYAPPSPGMPSVSASQDQELHVAPPGGKNDTIKSVEQPPAREPTERYCSNCGRKTKPSEHFCPNCGKQLV